MWKRKMWANRITQCNYLGIKNRFSLCTFLEKYGYWHTVYNNFRKLSQQGVMEKIFNYFCVNAKQSSQIQIDSTYVKAHQHSAGAKKKGDWGRE